MEQVVLPPGAVVGKGTVTFVVEHDDVKPSCLLLPDISNDSLGLISSVYWRDIGKRGTRIDVDLNKFSCEIETKGLRECMRIAGEIAIEAIGKESQWAACWKPPSPSMEPSYPYTVRESLEEDLGFAFVSKPTDKGKFDSIGTKIVATEPSTDTDPQPTVNGVCAPSLVKTLIGGANAKIDEACVKASEHPNQVSSVDLRPGMKICVQAEHRFNSSSSTRSRQASKEHCSRFVKGPNDLLAFPQIQQLTSPIYGPYLNAHTASAIFGVYDWSGIRSHALDSLHNAFQLTVYFPQIQSEQDQLWGSAGDIWLIEAKKANNAGPLVLLSGVKREIPNGGRKVPYSALCGSTQGFSCFLFMDRPSVYITQDIRMGQEVLEAELGITLGELAASQSLPPIELLRPFRDRPIPVKGNADQAPLVSGDGLRRLHD